jgi:broad-specificity NMP kinase
MVGALSRRHGADHTRRQLLIELAGPAGAGKSTLARTLMGRLDGTPGMIWGLPVLPLLGNGLRMIPTFGGLWLHTRSPLWSETRHMVRLRALSQALGRPTARPAELVIFDEGPVFALTWLRGFGHDVLREKPSAEWWRSATREWASVIDTVVVLDAPDQVLAQRIRARAHPHEVKELPDLEIARWMARFREALDWVLSEMARHGGPLVIRLSAERPVERIAEQLTEALNESQRAS